MTSDVNQDSIKRQLLCFAERGNSWISFIKKWIHKVSYW